MRWICSLKTPSIILKATFLSFLKPLHTIAHTPAPTPTTTIRLDPDDIAKARVQAAERGLRYQTYLKMIIHEALRDAEQKRKAS